MLLSAKLGAIEFVDNEVRVAVVKTGGRTPTVLELQSRTARYVEDEERIPAFVRAVGEAVDALKNPPAAFVLCASGRHSIVRSITIPIRGRKRVLAAATYELEPHLAFPIDELLLDFNIVAEVDGETEVLAVGVRRAHLEEQRAILDEAGIEVEAVNLDAVALTGLWQVLQKPVKGLQALLHVREQSCSLAVLFNGNLAYFRNIPLSSDVMVEAPARLARELQSTLRAFLAKWRGGGEIGDLQVTGVDLSPAELDELSTALRLPVTCRLMLAELPGGPAALAAAGVSSASTDQGYASADGDETNAADSADVADVSATWARDEIGPNHWEGTIGAACAGAGGALALDFDERGATQAGVARSVAPQLVYSSAMALVALLLWGGYYYIGTNYYRNQGARLQQEIDGLNAEIETLAKEGLGQDVNVDFYRDPPMLDVLEDIGKRMPESKVLITGLKVYPPGAESARLGWIDIDGSTEVAEHVGEAVSELSKSTLFRVDENSLKQTADGSLVTFSVTVRRIAEEGDDGSK